MIKKIYSNLNLTSKKSDIKSKDSFIDFNKNIIDTKLDINLNKNIFSVKLEDDLNKPKIIVDVQDLIKNILEKKLDKYINKEDDAQKIELLKGIKSLFNILIIIIILSKLKVFLDLILKKFNITRILK